ncbi:MAG TPA: DUF4124 domain-containing protein [Steroidobacteraceae bacterium]|nr:DUF4124 domain-containing protein [Steroidobacteraceae bacterium]
MAACPTITLQAGEIYKSVDAEGHVVYSDHLDTSLGQQSPVDIRSSEPTADLDVQASVSPPPLPDNEQPPCPDDGYLWTPGYWNWNAAGYDWIPGTWVQPPRLGVLWTPGYWEFVNAVYVFHHGYWAEHIGYYGGINYGFGYFGVGFAGGRWVNHAFAYNTAVSNVDARIVHNTYSESVTHNAAVNRVSYNGGPGGTTSVMTAREKALAAEKHFSATSAQRQYLTPHMPISVVQPTLVKAPAVAGARAMTPTPPVRQHEVAHAPPTNRAPLQATVARPVKPATTHPASSKPRSAMPYPKS